MFATGSLQHIREDTRLIWERWETTGNYRRASRSRLGIREDVTFGAPVGSVKLEMRALGAETLLEYHVALRFTLRNFEGLPELPEAPVIL